MTAPVLPWLPDRHLGAVSTLAHADELISQVGDLLFAYLRSGEVIAVREVPNGAVSDAVVEAIAPIPRRVPLLVADALVTLRAAIEHTLFTEVEFVCGSPLDERAARSIEMPASRTYEEFADWVRGRARRTPTAMAQGSEILRRVEGLQPYHRNIRPDLHPLARLALHTNHAKHRTPAITAVRLVTIVRDDRVPLSLDELDLRPEVPLIVGDVIAQTPLGQRVAASLFPTIGINRPGTDQWPILMHELDEISRWVREQAIPRLVTGGHPPPDKIPAFYEIDVGHEDERAAIGLGTSTAATERNKIQMGAAIARQNLVGALLPMSDDLTAEVITAWAAQLSDEHVLERVTRLKPGPRDDLSLVEQNVGALAVLRDEVLQFGAAAS
ncbi:hypothetical protein [Microbacterium sp. MYb66]|uniref:hypothetical protein n=1 Tax=Microbacterium sp. MYb66 TaxID=1848692 RepID=UPI000D00A056|nr:hypothetical protein [Microbacterium sp. MYb66]PRA83314.1 hypothetical protein CQ045_02710 [Microbacterium sp. MYb66]